jgi:hypothetical protein
LAWPARCTVPVPVPTRGSRALALSFIRCARAVLPPKHLKSLEIWKFLTNIGKPTRRPARLLELSGFF